MSLPVINLDDRQYDDLVAEAKQRLAQALPELAGLSPGDPLYYLVDVFAHLTDQLIYRSNLIPERQRQIYLNLMALPRRPVQPSQGMISLDLEGAAALIPKLIQKDSVVNAKKMPFSTAQEVLATPLQLRLLIKKAVAADLGELVDLYPNIQTTKMQTFMPSEIIPGQAPIHTRDSIDDSLYLALTLPKNLSTPEKIQQVRNALAGQLINIGLIPQRDVTASQYSNVPPRELEWQIAWCRREQAEDPLQCDYLPLSVSDDTSLGGRQAGVVRLRLPESQALLAPEFPLDPADAGLGHWPPALPEDVDPASLIAWIRLRAPQDALDFSYLAINAVSVSGQAVAKDIMLGIGNGEANQRIQLAQKDVDAQSLKLEVEHQQQFRPWYAVPHFAASGPDDPVYRIDAANGLIVFGDGIRGQRPARGVRIRAAELRYGGGDAGNVPAASIQALGQSVRGVKVRHEYPTWGGSEAESVADAEQRIAAFLRHRNRAVTPQDFVDLTLHNPINPVARAELLAGFHPGREFADQRSQVPGVVSLLVLPPSSENGGFPKPNAGLLSDVYHYLSERLLMGTELFVLSPLFVPIAVSASFDAIDPNQSLAVTRQVERSLQDYLWPLAPGGLQGQGWQMGRAVEASELYTAIARVSGVRAIYQLQLYTKVDGEWQPAAENRVELAEYALPELQTLALSANGENTAPKPGEVSQTPPSDAVPVPVLPDYC